VHTKLYFNRVEKLNVLRACSPDSKHLAYGAKAYKNWCVVIHEREEREILASGIFLSSHRLFSGSRFPLPYLHTEPRLESNASLEETLLNRRSIGNTQILP